MIEKKDLFCQLREENVEALVENKRGKEPTPVSCTKMIECDRTAFCRFVNPLTTRNPLSGSCDPAVATA